MKTVATSPALVHWFQGEQADEREGSFGNPLLQFPNLLAEFGWRESKKGVVVARKLTAKEGQAAVAERQEQVALWGKEEGNLLLYSTNRKTGRIVDAAKKEDVETQEISYAELAKFATKLWTNSKGKWIVPTHAGTQCYRRGSAVVASICAYLRYDGERTVDSFRVPIVERAFANEEEQLYARLDENNEAGQAGYTLVGMLAIALKLLGFLNSESDMMRRLNIKRGTAQKLHGWGILVSRFPGLRLLARIQQPYPLDGEGKREKQTSYKKGGFIPFGKLTAGAARVLLGTGDADDTAKEVIADWKNEKPATAAEVESYIQTVMAREGNAPKTMERKKIMVAALKKEVGNPLHEMLSAALTCVVNDDSTGLTALYDETSAAAQAKAGAVKPAKAKAKPVVASRKKK